MKTYLINLYKALINKPTIQEKEVVVTVPFSMQQVQELHRLFPVRRIGKYKVRDLLISEGHQEIIEFIERWGKGGGAHAVGK